MKIGKASTGKINPVAGAGAGAGAGTDEFFIFYNHRMFPLWFIDLNGYEYLVLFLAGLFLWGMFAYRARRKERRRQIPLPDQMRAILMKAGEPNIEATPATMSHGLSPWEYPFY
jgi:hypothetical protein